MKKVFFCYKLSVLISDTIYGAVVGKISSIEKLEKKFRSNPTKKDLTFAEAKRLLEHYGFTFHNSGGSHYSGITHDGKKFPTTIPFPHDNNGSLKRYIVRSVVALIDSVKEGEEK